MGCHARATLSRAWPFVPPSSCSWAGSRPRLRTWARPRFGAPPRARRNGSRSGRWSSGPSFEVVNQGVFPRLYPAFHLGLLALTVGLAARSGRRAKSRRVGSPGALCRSCCSRCGWPLPPPRSCRSLTTCGSSSLSRAPVLSRGVVAARRFAPPPPLDETSPVAERAPSLRDEAAARSIGAIATSCSSASTRCAPITSAPTATRATTPHIDRLGAARARVFEHAYCPTPHTSYSVTSMMTGKYMRPLLARALGGDSETWARLLRRYGYRTAAFYPPAVFFIDEHRFAPFRDRRPRLRVRARWSSPTPRASASRSSATSTSAPPDQPALLLGASVRAARALRGARRAPVRAIGTSIATTARSRPPTRASARS